MYIYPTYSPVADDQAKATLHDYIHVYTQHCADEHGSPTVLNLVVGVAVSVIVLVIAVVYIAAFATAKYIHPHSSFPEY